MPSIIIIIYFEKSNGIPLALKPNSIQHTEFGLKNSGKIVVLPNSSKIISGCNKTSRKGNQC